MARRSEKQSVILGLPAQNESSRPFLTSFCRTLLMVSILIAIYHFSTLSSWIDVISQQQPAGAKRVALEAHVITKCSSAQSALTDLVYPAIQKIHDKIDFRLTFIATPLEDGTVECKHGDGECEGSIVELCAQELYPDPRISLGFIVCLYGDYNRIPDRALYETCASEHSIDMEAIDQCTLRDDGEYGRDLLRRSAQRSIDLDALISCTIRLDDKTYCLRDLDVWQHCHSGTRVHDLVSAVDVLYSSMNRDASDGQLASS